MQMKGKRNIQAYVWLHRAYFIASLLALALSLVQGAAYYFTGLQSTVTVFDLFFVGLLLLLALYLRINALHYHQLMVRFTASRQTEQSVRMKRGTTNR